MELKENLSKNLTCSGPKKSSGFLREARGDQVHHPGHRSQKICRPSGHAGYNCSELRSTSSGLAIRGAYLGGCETAALHPGTGRMVCSALQPRSERHTMLAPGHCKTVVNLSFQVNPTYLGTLARRSVSERPTVSQFLAILMESST